MVLTNHAERNGLSSAPCVGGRDHEDKGKAISSTVPLAGYSLDLPDKSRADNKSWGVLGHTDL
jgi:hypothetical protein